MGHTEYKQYTKKKEEKPKQKSKIKQKTKTNTQKTPVEIQKNKAFDERIHPFNNIHLSNFFWYKNKM